MDSWFLFIVAIVGAIVATQILKSIDKLAGLMDKQAGLLDKQAGLMDKQAGLMERQLKEASKQLEVTQRPWISPKIALDGSTGLFAFSDGYSLYLKVQLDNIGQTPAVGVKVVHALHVYRAPGYLEEFCKEAANKRLYEGRVLFPGDSWTESLAVSGKLVDLQPTATSDVPYCINVIVCVVYRSSFDESARYYLGAKHYLYRLVKGDDHTTKTLSDFQPGKSVPGEELRLVHATFPGTIAQ